MVLVTQCDSSAIKADIKRLSWCGSAKFKADIALMSGFEQASPQSKYGGQSPTKRTRVWTKDGLSE
jgi:hypothetical protein